METALTILTRHNIAVPAEVQQLLAQFVELFLDYNSRVNLSAIRQPEAVWHKHVVDSLMLLAYEPLAGACIDVGTGGGLPGIPLAIARPSVQMTLLDSIGKKVVACRSFVEGLELHNTTAVQGRAEQIGRQPQHHGAYQTVLSRATAYLPILLAWCNELLAEDGTIVVYKTPSEQERHDGQLVAKELGLCLAREHRYELDGQIRYILVYERQPTTT